MNSSNKLDANIPQPWMPGRASTEQKIPLNADKQLPHSVAHAAFSVGCEVYRLQALFECVSTDWVVNRPALLQEIQSVARFVCSQLAVLKAELDDRLIGKAQRFFESLGIKKKSTRRKSAVKSKQKNSQAIKSTHSATSRWIEIAFELNAGMALADERVQRWWRAGSALGLVDVAVQSNPEKVLEHLKESQVKVKQLERRQQLPRSLHEFGYLDLETDAAAISSRLRQICGLKPEPRFHATSVIFDEWDYQMQVAKAATMFALAAREGLHAMALEQEQPKLANHARDKAMYELVANGGTLREAIELSESNPDFKPLLRESSVQKAIDAYARRYGLLIIRRKSSSKNDSHARAPKGAPRSNVK